LKDNPSYDTSRPGSQEVILPLDDFFTALKANGIGVTPAQIVTANKIMLHFAPMVPDEAVLCNYLCPVFATNQTEQARFREIFKEFYVPDMPGEHGEDDEAPSHFKKHWWKYLLALLAITGIAIWLWNNSRKKIPEDFTITFSITGQNTGDGINNGSNFQYVAGDTLQASVTIADSDGSPLTQTGLRTRYLWGDKTPAEIWGRHVYKKSGIYTMQIFADAYYNNNLVKKDTLTTILKICDFKNGLQISIPNVNDSVPIIKPVLLIATVDNPVLPDSIAWSIQSEAGTVDYITGTYQDKKQVNYAFDSAGQYTIACQAIYDNSNGPCTYTSTRPVYAYDASKSQVSAAIRTAQGAKPLKPAYTVKPFWYWVMGLGALFFSWLAYFFNRQFMRYQRRRQLQPMPDADYEAMLGSFSSNQPPGDMPFVNKNYLALPEPVLADAARLMRRRIEGDAAYMHIGKTIGKAIQNNGFFQPVLSRRTQQCEYLVLIDENHINNQQVKLFDYLVDMLHRHNVFVDKYYYRYEPSLCYSSKVPNGISLEKLSEKYPQHVLIMFGNGYQLVYQYQPVISSNYLALLHRWQYKAILTPVSFLDWDVKEKNILPSAIPVFPVDAEGQLLLMQTLFDGTADTIAALQQQSAAFYETETVDFEDVDELADYCGLAKWANSSSGNPFDNLLFQWIAALALYPRIQWELTLYMGKSLLDKAGQGHQLNFTSLLRIARIQWMKEGMLPSDIRLELLKKLTRPNEVLARETILLALAEIPPGEVRPGHYAYEEKETQRIINEFNLYAYDPEKYAAYASSKIIFERLWKDKKIMEAPVKQYLRNDALQWPTLINNPADGVPDDAENVAIDNYFAPPPGNVKGLAKLYDKLSSVISFMSGLCGLAFIALLVLEFSNTSRFRQFTKQQKKVRSVAFTYTDSTTKTHVKEIFIRVNDSVTTFAAGSTGRLLLPLSDSPRMVSIAVDNKVVFDSLVQVDKDSYNIVLKDKVKEKAGVMLTIFTNYICAPEFKNGRYSKVVEALDKNNWPVIRLTAADNRQSSPVCLAELRAGSGVDEKLVSELIERFKQVGIYLTLRPGGVDRTNEQNQNQNSLTAFEYTILRQQPGGVADDLKQSEPGILLPREGEIIVSGNTYDDTEVPKPGAPVDTTPKVIQEKPIIIIKVSDQSLVASATAFSKALMQRGLTVKPVEVDANNGNNSEIYFLDANMVVTAKEVEQLYTKYYPVLPLKATLKPSRLISDNRVWVWMKKLDKPKNPDIPSGNETGQRIVNIALKEVGNGIYEPGGINRTKYGNWFDAKQNQAGLPWAAVFVSWVYSQAGVAAGEEENRKGFSSFSAAFLYFKNKGLLTDNPVPGDIMVIDLIKGGYHGGIFVRWIDKEKGTFETVEGNVTADDGEGNVVAKKIRSTQTQKIYFAHIEPKGVAAD
jgi:hypothetical protein